MSEEVGSGVSFILFWWADCCIPRYDDETVLKRLLLSMGYRDHEMDTHQADASNLNASGVAKGDGSKVAL